MIQFGDFDQCFQSKVSSSFSFPFSGSISRGFFALEILNMHFEWEFCVRLCDSAPDLEIRVNLGL